MDDVKAEDDEQLTAWRAKIGHGDLVRVKVDASSEMSPNASWNGKVLVVEGPGTHDGNVRTRVLSIGTCLWNRGYLEPPGSPRKGDHVKCLMGPMEWKLRVYEVESTSMDGKYAQIQGYRLDKVFVSSLLLMPHDVPLDVDETDETYETFSSPRPSVDDVEHDRRIKDEWKRVATEAQKHAEEAVKERDYDRRQWERERDQFAALVKKAQEESGALRAQLECERGSLIRVVKSHDEWMTRAAKSDESIEHLKRELARADRPSLLARLLGRGSKGSVSVPPLATGTAPGMGGFVSITGGAGGCAGASQIPAPSYLRRLGAWILRAARNSVDMERPVSLGSVLVGALLMGVPFADVVSHQDRGPRQKEIAPVASATTVWR